MTIKQALFPKSTFLQHSVMMPSGDSQEFLHYNEIKNKMEFGLPSTLASWTIH